ncbi:MAG TPA: alpha/beta fold hydrolase [Blastocatellia bacterium]|nr:alpha/beta fold hydrolase [Blastocatellia bacterium]
MNIRFSVALIIIGASSLIQAQEGQVRLSPSEINALASVNAGAGTSGVSGIQTRTLKGDASKPGSYTIQLTIPANVRIQAHTHPDDRVATVISGVWYIGYGESFDESKLRPLTAGSFYTEPPGVGHFAKTGNEPVLLQITGNGPTGTEYVEAGATSAATKTNYDSLFANVNGVRLHYLKSGSGKTPLVLIHGFGDDARMWLPLFADFGKDYTMIAPDLRGLGQSSREKGGYDKKTAAVDIHELVKSLGYKDIYLVGHDIGMMVAYAYAAQFPAEVKKLALLDAPIPGVGDVWEKIYTTPALWHFHFVNSPIALELVNGRERVFLEHVWQSFGGDLAKFSEKEKRMYAQNYAQPGVMRDAFEYFKAFEPQDAADNRNFARTKLPMPLLVIEGEKGMNGVLAIQAALISDHVKAIKFPSGHWLMEEKPIETSAALKDFFRN